MESRECFGDIVTGAAINALSFRMENRTMLLIQSGGRMQSASVQRIHSPVAAATAVSMAFFLYELIGPDGIWSFEIDQLIFGWLNPLTISSVRSVRMVIDHQNFDKGRGIGLIQQMSEDSSDMDSSSFLAGMMTDTFVKNFGSFSEVGKMRNLVPGSPVEIDQHTISNQKNKVI